MLWESKSGIEEVDNESTSILFNFRLKCADVTKFMYDYC